MFAPSGIERELAANLNQQLLNGTDIFAVVENRRNQNRLVNLAAQASENSPHYDGISKFGAAALGLILRSSEQKEQGLNDVIKVYATHNGTAKYGDYKSCAEMTEDDMTRADYTNSGGRLIVPLLAVYGPSNKKRIREITGSDDYKQCIPCHDCLWRLATNPAHYYDTKVIAANTFGRRPHLLGRLVNAMAMVPRPATSGEKQQAERLWTPDRTLIPV